MICRAFFHENAHPDIISPKPIKAISNSLRCRTRVCFAPCNCRWQDWEAYSEIIKGILLSASRVTGRCAKIADIAMTCRIRWRFADHPVTEGLPPKFEITDELYLYEAFEDDVNPLLQRFQLHGR